MNTDDSPQTGLPFSSAVMPGLWLPLDGLGQAPESVVEPCIICQWFFPPAAGVLCATKEHFFCSQCLVLYFRSAIESGQPTPPTCCGRPLPVSPESLPKDIYVYFEAVARKWEDVDVVRCSNMKCRAPNSRPFTLRPVRISFSCWACDRLTCWLCRNPGHLSLKICAERPDPADAWRVDGDGSRVFCHHPNWYGHFIDPIDLPFRCHTCNRVVRDGSFWRCGSRGCGMKECQACARRRRWPWEYAASSSSVHPATDHRPASSSHPIR
ncbi:hypothetical protein F5144DRAFT_328213 [Chaetomium tenue]|uniref:Uncharacterized protein n=1 Tax=Chaetomium tenue TaxID=1854479 RepID=A0ACB7P496_9PEZI|nr:hypothetical protein F5144DRAFT_328213 [Chaetomium globosum]